MESITESVLRYQKTGSGYEEIVKRISMIIYNYPKRLHILTEEDQSDFYLSFYILLKEVDNIAKQRYACCCIYCDKIKFHFLSLECF